MCHQTTTLRATPAPFPAHDGYWAGHCQELLPSSRQPVAQGQQGIGSPFALPLRISLISYCMLRRPILLPIYSVKQQVPFWPAEILSGRLGFFEDATTQ